MNTHKFDCGCEFEIDNEGKLVININNIPLTCQTTWDLLGHGDTKGIFQLESQLGKKWTKELKPLNIEHLAALTAILRPGTLKAIEDGKSLTQHYCDRKNGKDKVEYFHPSLRTILESTYGILVYQEQAMEIAKQLAGFNLKEADELRKAAGKKDAKKMMEVKEKFIAGCIKLGIVSKEEAEHIFGWIEKSSRYSFNKCISGNTQIKVFPYFDVEVKDIYRRWQNGDNTVVLNSIDKENNVGINFVKNIWYRGEMPVYRVTTRKGYADTTLNHRFPTPFGDKTVQELKVGDLLYVEKHNKVKTTSILSIEYEKIDDVYDIEMDAPNHNFILSNGIVTSNSHSVSYGITGYHTAYLKQHFPIQFFTEYLKMADEKQKPFEEVDELVNDAKIHNFEIYPPSILRLEDNFTTDHDKKIFFGIVNIKGVGLKQYEKLVEQIPIVENKINKKLADWTFNDFLIQLSDNLNQTTVRNLIKVGALDHLNISRARMLYEYGQWNGTSTKDKGLSDKEKDWVRANVDYNGKSLAQVLECSINGGGFANKNRKVILEGKKYLLENPPHDLKDTMGSIAYHESELLGTTLTFSKVDDCNTEVVNCSCKEFLEGKDGYLVLGVEVKKVKEITAKNGQKMAFINIGDNSAICDGTVFSKQLKQYKGLLKVGNTVLLKCSRDKKYKSLIVNEVIQI